MKIKMKTLSAGPNGVRNPGQICEVPEAEGKALIAGKYAEAVQVQAPPKVEQKAEPKVEKPESDEGFKYKPSKSKKDRYDSDKE